jgi:hypothetical protein
MRRTVSAVVGLAICLGAGSAQAQDFGESMTVVFSADRLFGLHFSKRTTEAQDPSDPDLEDDATTIELGWTGRQHLSPFDIARFAFESLVIDGLCVGGAMRTARTIASSPPASVTCGCSAMSPASGSAVA